MRVVLPGGYELWRCPPRDFADVVAGGLSGYARPPKSLFGRGAGGGIGSLTDAGCWRLRDGGCRA